MKWTVKAVPSTIPDRFVLIGELLPLKEVGASIK